MNPIPAQINYRVTELRDHSGDRITSGTVNYYLKALSGTNAGKWLTKDANWSASEVAYGSTGTPSYATHEGSGVWSQSVIAAGWVEGVYYAEYWVDTLGKISRDFVGPVYCTGVTQRSAASIATGTVNAVTSASNFTLTSTDLSTNNDDYNNMWLVFTSGSNKFVPRLIQDYVGSTKNVLFTGTGLKGAFPQTVAPGDAFQILAGGS